MSNDLETGELNASCKVQLAVQHSFVLCFRSPIFCLDSSNLEKILFDFFLPPYRTRSWRTVAKDKDATAESIDNGRWPSTIQSSTGEERVDIDLLQVDLDT